MILGLVGYFAVGIFVLRLGYHYPGDEQFGLTFVLFEVVMSIGRWSWIFFALSLGAKYLNFNNKVLSYGNEAVLPFYIFHQTIILCIGWFVIPLNLGMLPKYLIIAVTSFALIIVLYESLVKRLSILRLGFGMRSLKESATHISSRNRYTLELP